MYYLKHVIIKDIKYDKNEDSCPNLGFITDNFMTFKENMVVAARRAEVAPRVVAALRAVVAPRVVAALTTHIYLREDYLLTCNVIAITIKHTYSLRYS